MPTPENIKPLIDAYPALQWSDARGLSGSGKFLFVATDRAPSGALPAIPALFAEGDAYLLVPAAEDWSELKPAPAPFLGAAHCASLAVHMPDGPSVSGDKWRRRVLEYCSAGAKDARDGKRKIARLEELRRGSLYATRRSFEREERHLVSDFIRRNGITVCYGDWDEFKTSTVTDLAAHIAAGANWQGRSVTCCPVIYYALEAEDDVLMRLHALEARLRGAWGDDSLPVTVADNIPGDYLGGSARPWREHVLGAWNQWIEVEDGRFAQGHDGAHDFFTEAPVIVIDTLSMALKGEDEKGHKAVAFIHACQSLLKALPVEDWTDDDADEVNRESYGGLRHITEPVASHVIVIAHQTKTGDGYAGHRAIGADTGGLYRIHRFGRMGDKSRSMAGQITPLRTKGMLLPPPLRFEVEVVPVKDTERRAAILKVRTNEIGEHLEPVITALRELVEVSGSAELNAVDVKGCVDRVADNRTTRMRRRKELEDAGILEPLESGGFRVHLPEALA